MPEAGPPPSITALLEKLSWDNPVKLLDLVGFLHGHNAVSNQEWFEKLVQQTLPERAWEILGIRNESGQVMRFAAVFSDTHFPLDENHLEMLIEWQMDDDPEEFEPGEYGPYAILRRGIPFDLMGCSWEARHELWNSAGMGTAAIALLARMPGMENPHQILLKEYLGMRTSWLESAASHLREETLKRIPENGIPMELLEETVRETPLEAAFLDAQWIYNETGNFFLDYNPTGEDGFEGFSDPWDDEIIGTGIEEWAEAKPIRDKIDRLEDWLEKDIDKRFEEMLDFILERLASIPENFKRKEDDQRE